MYSASTPAALTLNSVSALAIRIYVIMVRDQSARLMKLDLNQFPEGTKRGDLMFAANELLAARLAIFDPDQSYPLLVPLRDLSGAFSLSNAQIHSLSLASIDGVIDSDTVLFIFALAQQGHRELVKLCISVIVDRQLANLKAELEA